MTSADHANTVRAGSWNVTDEASAALDALVAQAEAAEKMRDTYFNALGEVSRTLDAAEAERDSLRAELDAIKKGAQ